MKMSGIDVGPPRLPLVPLSQEQYEKLEKELKSNGYL
jgi:dihydrodipicolinate synthase/N-acetylneuraminate lyase